jgi:hypothetical protein
MTSMLAYLRITLSMRQFVARSDHRFNREAVTSAAPLSPLLFVSLPDDRSEESGETPLARKILSVLL